MAITIPAAGFVDKEVIDLATQAKGVTDGLQTQIDALAGGGTGIVIQQDGVPLPGVYTVVNMISPNLTVVDSGGGVATVTATGGSGNPRTIGDVPTPAPDNTTTQFSTSAEFVLASTDVFVNGQRITLGTDYTEAMDGLSITFAIAPLSSDIITIDYLGT